MKSWVVSRKQHGVSGIGDECVTIAADGGLWNRSQAQFTSPIVDNARKALPMRPAAKLVAFVAMTIVALSGCSSSDTEAAPTSTPLALTGTPTTATPAPDIVISNFGYTVRAPVTPGQEVTVVNDDQANHSLAADGNDAFDVRVSGGGGLATFTAPTIPGTYEFHCKYHANMHGALTVQ